MEEGLELYIPKGPRKLVDHYRPKFQIRTGSHDEKAIETVWPGTATAGTGTASSQNLGELWLDIGANVGAFGVMAHKFGAEVVSIEPEPSNATLCASNLEFNGIDNPEVLEVAVVPRCFCRRLGDAVHLEGKPPTAQHRAASSRQRRAKGPSQNTGEPGRRVPARWDQNVDRRRGDPDPAKPRAPGLRPLPGRGVEFSN